MRHAVSKTQAVPGQAAGGAPPPFALLTPTQRKVLDGVYSGRLNKQIAFDLGIAEATVKAHMTALMRKLQVRNRTQLAITARSLGWNGRTLAH
ncbi:MULTISPECIES: LuxR C-terminal-related transcriptional regulator [unclassified Sphingomonas]|uniref:response regulator transcription factor n=1 Tax=unclassified Sphingomonas TaxID=196159 RepID=UPI001F594931|nr:MULTISPECIES: LuxR C-terminal-related transcriptional regulator [unclassified Sphingomonas]